MSIIIGKTSLVLNTYSKFTGLPEFSYRYRVCDTNLNGNTPADQYQKLKLIQNTVRVKSSLYTSDLASLSAYKKPISNPNAGLYGVCWNQMSDRPVPSVQKASVPTGYHTSMNRRHTSVTSSKPGSQTPGGAGCDIKHNSYDRYLNRLKAKGPLRRGRIPTLFGNDIPFNPAFPVYGGKTVKTNIVSGCDCPVDNTPVENLAQDELIYNDPNWQPGPNNNYYIYTIGSFVYAKKPGKDFYSKGVILDISPNPPTYSSIYTIQLLTDYSISGYTYIQLMPYFDCDC
jgi:hypothetical protein